MKTASQIVESFKAKTEVEVDYASMTKDELIIMIKDLKSIKSSKTVNELVITLLLDPDYLDASNIEIAGAIRLLIPGSETTSKSVSSIRSVYNKQVLDKALTSIQGLDGKELMLAKAGLEFDLLRSGELIPPRQ